MRLNKCLMFLLVFYNATNTDATDKINVWKAVSQCQFTANETVHVASDMVCAQKATNKRWVNLFKFEDGKCELSDKNLIPNANPNAGDLCKTKHSTHDCLVPNGSHVPAGQKAEKGCSGLVCTKGKWLLNDTDSVFQEDEDWVIIPQKILSQTDTTETVMMDNACECQNSCFTSASCSTSSIEVNPAGGIECRKTNKPLHDVLLESPSKVLPGQMTFAKKSSFDYFFGEDGMFYRVLETDYTFDGATAFCEGLTGGQLLTLDNMESVRSFRRLVENYNPSWPLDGNGYLIVSLKKESTGNVWRNGVVYDSGNAEYTSQMRLDATGSGSTYRVVLYVDYFELKLHESSLMSTISCQIKNF